MSREAVTKERVLEFDRVIFNERRLDLLDRYVADGVVDHNVPPAFPPGIEGKRLFLRQFLDAFPDLALAVDDVLVEGDRAAERFTMTGTHLGDLMGFPATGKSIRQQAIAISRYENGKQVEHWLAMDQLSFLQQLGVIPVPGDE